MICLLPASSFADILAKAQLNVAQRRADCIVVDLGDPLDLALNRALSSTSTHDAACILAACVTHGNVGTAGHMPLHAACRHNRQDALRHLLGVPTGGCTNFPDLYATAIATEWDAIRGTCAGSLCEALLERGSVKMLPSQYLAAFRDCGHMRTPISGERRVQIAQAMLTQLRASRDTMASPVLVRDCSANTNAATDIAHLLDLYCTLDLSHLNTDVHPAADSADLVGLCTAAPELNDPNGLNDPNDLNDLDDMDMDDLDDMDDIEL